jgi:hypothetical protein
LECGIVAWRCWHVSRSMPLVCGRCGDSGRPAISWCAYRRVREHPRARTERLRRGASVGSINAHGCRSGSAGAEDSGDGAAAPRRALSGRERCCGGSSLSVFLDGGAVHEGSGQPCWRAAARSPRADGSRWRRACRCGVR